MSTITHTYTLEEVAKHNTPESRWIAIDGSVYDVTEFIKTHPGGTKPFEKYSGTDASTKFHKISNHAQSYEVPSIMTKLCIGKLSV